MQLNGDGLLNISMLCYKSIIPTSVDVYLGHFSPKYPTYHKQEIRAGVFCLVPRDFIAQVFRARSPYNADDLPTE